MGVSKLSHAIAALVLESPEPFEAHWRGALAAIRPLVSHHAASMRAAGLIEGEVPAHGCMYFPRIVGVDDTLALARRLYHRHRVLVAPGEYFGAPGHLRIGFGAGGQTIAAGLQRLEAALRAERGSRKLHLPRRKRTSFPVLPPRRREVRREHCAAKFPSDFRGWGTRTRT